MPPKAGKALTLDEFLDRLNKDLGPGTAMQLGSEPMPDIEVISTGSITVDEALGRGGLARGRVIEIYGPESSGKTSAALMAVGQAQKAGLLGGFIDAEHALDPEWAAKLGVDTAALVVSQPDTGEQALQVAQEMAQSGLFGILVIDSVAALTPRAEIEGEMGDSHVGLQARLMSQALRKLTGILSQSKTTAVFINQLRERIGVFYGNPETTAGGKALKFYASVRVDIRRIETLAAGTEKIGIRSRVKVVKNKLSPPFREGEVTWLFATGFSHEAELVDLGVKRGFIKKAGAWYSVVPEESGVVDVPLQLGQGADAARQYLENSPELAARLDKAIRAKVLHLGAAALPGSAKLAAPSSPPAWAGEGSP